MLGDMLEIKPRSSTAHGRRARRGWFPLVLGFRPFFLLAGLAGILLLVLWPLVWQGRLAAPLHYGSVGWHAHEMLFGFAVAVIAGFLLTAVRNWTGLPTWTGPRLGLLALVWLAGRLLPWLDGMPVALWVAVDVAFLPLLALSLYRPLWGGQNRVNRLFLPLLLMMGLANLLSQLQLLGSLNDIGDMRRTMLYLIVLLITLVGGRVLPFFTRSVLPGFEPIGRPWVEHLTFALLASIILVESIASPPAALSGPLWLAFALVQAIRLGGWFDRRMLAIPVLWVLHLGYAWLVLGALLSGLAALELFPRGPALHALGVGAVGVFTIGMMARVAHGHTGRPIDVGPGVTLAFLAVNAAALLRVFATVGWGSHHALWVDLSAALWVIGFGLFAWHYVPILLRPRVDGKPG
jgi:uncharacterized protein involved in response to NO